MPYLGLRSAMHVFLCNIIVPDGDRWPMIFYVTWCCQTAICQERFFITTPLPDGDPWPVFFYVTSSCQTAIVPLPPSGGRGAGRLGASPLLLWQAQWPGNGRAMDGQWTGNGKATAMRSKCAPAQAMTSNRQRQGNGNGNGKS